MHTRDVSSVLRSFALGVDFSRSEQLFKLALFIETGANETIFSRLKRLSPSTSYPPQLKESLEVIQAIFRSAGARKQAGIISAVLELFKGRPNGDVETFLVQVSSAPLKPDRRARLRRLRNGMVIPSSRRAD